MAIARNVHLKYPLRPVKAKGLCKSGLVLLKLILSYWPGDWE